MDRASSDRVAKQAIAESVWEFMQKILAFNDSGEWDETICFDGYAIRTQETPFEPGPVGHVSHRWDDGDDSGEELEGLSGTRIASMWGFDADALVALKAHFGLDGFSGGYPGEHVALIGYTRGSGGEDPYEVVMEDPFVVKVFS